VLELDISLRATDLAGEGRTGGEISSWPAKGFGPEPLARTELTARFTRSGPGLGERESRAAGARRESVSDRIEETARAMRAARARWIGSKTLHLAHPAAREQRDEALLDEGGKGRSGVAGAALPRKLLRGLARIG
jgi:hypothetical protein